MGVLSAVKMEIFCNKRSSKDRLCNAIGKTFVLVVNPALWQLVLQHSAQRLCPDHMYLILLQIHEVDEFRTSKICNTCMLRRLQEESGKDISLPTVLSNVFLQNGVTNLCRQGFQCSLETTCPITQHSQASTAWNKKGVGNSRDDTNQSLYSCRGSSSGPSSSISSHLESSLPTAYNKHILVV